jgi:hypothetical protein
MEHKMSSKESVQSAINSAVSQNMISAAAADIMLEDLDDIAAAGATGVDVDDIDSEEATLVVVAIDASSSMSPYQKDVIAAYNEQFLAPLQASKQADNIYVTLWVFSSGVRLEPCRLIHGYKPVKNAPKIDQKIYEPDGATPLNMAVHRSLTGLVSYGQQLRDAGTNTKCIAVVLTDGEDNDSAGFTDSKIKQLSDDLLRQEYYILSYIFFGPDAAAKNQATRIGFPERHMITANLSDSEIRRIFGTVSASVITASKSSVSSSGLSSNAFVQVSP